MAETPNPRQNVTFASNGTQAHGYLARPPSDRGPGLIVIQEWWGLTDHIAGIADRFASEGFVALAPDLYGGPTTHEAEEAGRLMQELPPGRAARDLSGAVDYILGLEETTGDKVGAVGFCMGGGFVLALAAQRPDRVAAAVAFYPVGPTPEDLSGIAARVMVHVAEQDQFLPLPAAAELKERIARATGSEPLLHTYPAGHAFVNDENLLGTYDPEQASLAWHRTVQFLRSELG